MKLVSIELENIRSYEHGFMNFPDGSILLSGDIGSGKSTVLLATEFALFGIRRGELSGGALLRRGKKSGFVRLTISLDNKETIIERKLRRTASSVEQESGGITIDGVETKGTPTELKAKILTMLGYPLDLIDKQKSLLYRYTVYTPQEQLKNIMSTSAEERLNSLRKVFGVDRYRQIQENLDQFLSQLRAKKRLLKGIHKNLDEKLTAKSSLKGKLSEAKDKVVDLNKKEAQIKEELEKWKEKKREIEDEVRLFTENDKILSSESEKENSVRAQLTEKDTQIDTYSKLIEKIDNLESPTEKSEEEIRNKIKDLDKKIRECLTETRGVNEAIDKILEKVDGAVLIIEEKKERRTQIETLLKSLGKSKKELKAAGDICPICGKELTEVHRKKKIGEYDNQIDNLKQENTSLEEEIESLDAEKKKLQGTIKEKREAVVKSYSEEKEEMERLKESLKEYISEVGKRDKAVEASEIAQGEKKALSESLGGIEKTIREAKKKLEELSDVKEKKEGIEEKIGEIQGNLGHIGRELGTVMGEKGQLTERVEALDKEIKEMKTARKFEEKLTTFEGWLSDHLINLAGTIEKHYMVELKRKFDPLFGDWFNMLVDDDDMEARIDDEFTPVVEKEGYEAEYETLSGGEGASVALAYRLALNRVVNTMVDEIKTKDIIILDEPTDGFSNTQMDKIRDIIKELGVSQTIIVSHEPKIESYVDNIVRIRKEDGLSKIQS